MRPPLRAMGCLVLALVLLGLATADADAKTWAWLGVRIRDLSEHEMEELAARHGIREGFGVVIVDVMEGAPAARAGLKSGDIVVAFDGKPVTDTRTLQRMVASATVEAGRTRRRAASEIMDGATEVAHYLSGAE